MVLWLIPLRQGVGSKPTAVTLLMGTSRRPCGHRCVRSYGWGAKSAFAHTAAYLHRPYTGEQDRSSLVIKKCISRESNPGHIDGNDVFCH